MFGGYGYVLLVFVKGIEVDVLKVVGCLNFFLCVIFIGGVESFVEYCYIIELYMGILEILLCLLIGIEDVGDFIDDMV